MSIDLRRGIRIRGRIAIPADEIEFIAVRAQGSGGQNVNKVSTAVQLRFDAVASRALSDDIKQRLLALADQRITSDGVVVIKAQQYRSQSLNKLAALERLEALIEQALHTPKPRKPTRPGRAAHERRLDAKERRGNIKRSRRPPLE